ncbi:MAG: PstS family phosphate ABC transporter substrate-binding protein, partial [Mariprofundales bacterium]
MLKKSLIALAVCSMSVGVAQARDQITIVGSSTVFPFSSYVAEELGATTSNKTPVVESTGSGGGMKLFCAGTNIKTPDISNASRRMKIQEFKTCQKNGVTAITEAVIGYDGIALAQSKKNAPLVLSRQDVLLAVAKDVPNKAGTALIPNPYKFWNQVNSKLPHRPIVVYGPPTTSGTRDAFEDLAMKSLTKKMAVYKAVTKKYHKVRQDGVYVPSGENDNLIVQKLIKDQDAIGIFGYSFLEENSDQVTAASIDGSVPAPKSVANGSYPYSRSLYFYIKHDHLGKVAGVKEYTDMFMSEDMIGDAGQLSEIGLIPAAA